MSNDHLLTAQQAADALGVHLQTVRFWVRIGLLKKVPIGNVRYRIARAEIDRFISEREVEAV